MGRHKKYQTLEERWKANRLATRKYYLINRELIKQKRMERYHRNKVEKEMSDV